MSRLPRVCNFLNASSVAAYRKSCVTKGMRRQNSLREVSATGSNCADSPAQGRSSPRCPIIRTSSDLFHRLDGWAGLDRRFWDPRVMILALKRLGRTRFTIRSGSSSPSPSRRCTGQPEILSVDDADRRSSGDPRPSSIQINAGRTDQSRRRPAVDLELVSAMWVDALSGAESHGPSDRIRDHGQDLHASAVAVKDRIVRRVYSRRWVERFAELKDERRVHPFGSG